MLSMLYRREAIEKAKKRGVHLPGLPASNWREENQRAGTDGGSYHEDTCQPGQDTILLSPLYAYISDCLSDEPPCKRIFQTHDNGQADGYYKPSRMDLSKPYTV